MVVGVGGGGCFPFVLSFAFSLGGGGYFPSGVSLFTMPLIPFSLFTVLGFVWRVVGGSRLLGVGGVLKVPFPVSRVSLFVPFFYHPSLFPLS